MSNLKKNYTLIVDKSGSMATGSPTLAGKSLYQEAEEATLGLVSKLNTLDPDGIDLYFFSSSFKRYEGVTPTKVKELYESNDAMGSTKLDMVLQDAFNHANKRLATNNGFEEMIIVVTDGEPDDRKAVANVIINQANKQVNDSDLTLLILQIGNDIGAGKFLKALDDDLKDVGCKHDIVDVKTYQDMENVGINQILIEAVTD